MATESSAADEADVRRDAMVSELEEWGDLRSDGLVQAVRAVPRHLFVPDAALEVVYAPNKAVVTNRDQQGLATSLLSATHTQITMLEQAQIEPGMRVLEIGSNGYNASLISELVGESGSVVSLDIDPDVVEQARRGVEAAGYEHRVTVALGDGENGYEAQAPFDRIIVTAGAWDIPPAWWQQLAPDGRIVVPLRMRGLTRSVVLERRGSRLASTSYRLCAFVPMQGVSAREERLIPLEGSEVALRVEEEQLLDVRGLQTSLQQPRLEWWPGIEFVDPAQTHFWISTAVPVLGLLAARQGAVDRDLVARSATQSVPTLIRGSSFAYRTKRSIEGTDRFEHGVYAHGPEAEAVAEEYSEVLRRFDRDLRDGPGAEISVFPASTPTSDLPRGRIHEKRHTRVVVSWPGAQEL